MTVQVVHVATVRNALRYTGGNVGDLLKFSNYQLMMMEVPPEVHGYKDIKTNVLKVMISKHEYIMKPGDWLLKDTSESNFDVVSNEDMEAHYKQMH